MTCFTFQSMRSALPSTRATRPTGQTRATLSLPSFSGLHNTSRLPSSLISGDSTADSLALAPQNGSKVFMMRHGRRVARLGRPADQRKALVRNLTTEVLRHGKIKTTLVKAKAIRKYVDRMITLAKRGDLHARRQAQAFMFDKELVNLIFAGAEELYGDRQGGYCRVKSDGTVRRGDGTRMAIIELV